MGELDSIFIPSVLLALEEALPRVSFRVVSTKVSLRPGCPAAAHRLFPVGSATCGRAASLAAPIMGLTPSLPVVQSTAHLRSCIILTDLHRALVPVTFSFIRKSPSGRRSRSVV